MIIKKIFRGKNKISFNRRYTTNGKKSLLINS